MDSSWLIVVSFVGLALGPFWAKWSNLVVARLRLSRLAHVIGVVVLSAVAMTIAFVGPWLLMAAILGRLPQLFYEDRIGLAAAIMFGPGLVLQIVLALIEAKKQSTTAAS